MKPPTVKKSVRPIIPVRTRKLAKPDSSVPDTAQIMAALARKVITENKKMNEAKGKHDAARKELFSLMVTNSLTTKDIPADDEGPALKAIIETPESDVVDVQKLSERVDLKTLLLIVTATKKAVEDKAGALTCAAVCVRTKGKPNVTVKLLDK